MSAPKAHCSTPALLQASNLWLRRGERELYAGLGVGVQVGELIWLRGPNGRGKTTLLRILAGLLSPEQGDLLWHGQAFSQRLEQDQQAISYLDERLGLARDLSLWQNLQYIAGLSGSHEAQHVLRRLNLQHLADRPISRLSTGQKKRCGMARLLLETSQLWLLDEPANGLDDVNRQLLCELIQQHTQAGGACVFASHDELPFNQPPRSLNLEDA